MNKMTRKKQKISLSGISAREYGYEYLRREKMIWGHTPSLSIRDDGEIVVGALTNITLDYNPRIGGKK